MTDFFEIDFLDVEAAKSGDAIPLRYQLNGATYIHVVDGGFQDTGDKVVEHINKYYGNPIFIDRVVVTHPDGDHAGGLRKVLEAFLVKELWMLRPWNYAAEILHRFTNYTSVERLASRLKQIYPNIAVLEEIAVRSGIPIYEPFQGASIGAFKVLAPSKLRYLNLIVESERTPESPETLYPSLNELLRIPMRKVINYIKGAWGAEVFSPEETSSENEMSVIQYANIAGEKILLTGDAGRAGLLEAAIYAPYVGLQLPGINHFQVPHHGSRRNVSTEVLDLWLGARLPERGAAKFTAIISSAKKDEDHPRKAVVRALCHRGAMVLSTEGQSKRIQKNAAPRKDWVAAVPLDYPEDQEE
jgi:hypothetical protein